MVVRRKGENGARPGGKSAKTEDSSTAQPVSAARIAVVSVAAALLALQVGRLTAATDAAKQDADRALFLAPASPDVLAAAAMADVGRAAAAGGDPSQATMRRLQSIATIAPLRTEPFLVQAALAERAGNLERAEMLLRKAKSLDPRSTAARYLLADVWLRQNKVAPALGEMAMLARLMPSTSLQLVPALAEYAHNPGAREQLGLILEANPKLRTPLLASLAADPSNADLIVALAGPEERSNETASLLWKSRLLNRLVDQGNYQQAHSLWHRFVGLPVDSSRLLFNGSFRRIDGPEPFSWKYRSGSAGLAEPADGTLRVLYYGRENITLASQLLLLEPGSYVFASPVSGKAEDSALEWRLTCVTGGRLLVEHPIISRPPIARFTVPAGCPAQKLELVGIGSDTPNDTDVQIGPVTMERLRG